ncbi:type IV pilus biogenesis protein PilM [Collimonas humicola]|uniref:type IV pilus biogenesis protein PilM n=1 Tax=Collimonas humicola TaxID=2825886 RepID=UPI001B8BEAEA|nr:type IV pilus biogenesis protein PilM [Collimonas humicola]
MWGVLMLVCMLSVAGYYSMAGQENLIASENSVAANLAINMAVYRQAVIDYSSANPAALATSVASGALSLPSWGIPSALSRWDNYIDRNGVIYVFTRMKLPVNITADIVSLSRNSVLAGEAAATAAGSLYLNAPADIAVTPLAAQQAPRQVILLPAPAAIPVGSPVWLASRN